MELSVNMEVRKNYKFKGGYNIRGREGIFFFDDIDTDKCIECENEKIAIPYVYYDRHYRKHMQDTAYFTIDEFLNIRNKIKNKNTLLKRLSIKEVNEIVDEVFPIVTVKWADGLKVYKDMRVFKDGKFTVCEGIKVCWFTGEFKQNNTVKIYK